MNPARRSAIVTGVLLIAAIATALVAAQLVDPVLAGANYLGDLAARRHQVAGGALVYLVAAATSAGIAVALYPVLQTVHATLALSSVVFRALEAGLYVLAVVSLLSVLTLSRQHGADATDLLAVQAVGDALVSMRDHATLAGVFAFCLGAAAYYVAFYRSRLVPRWLSGWGIAATIGMLIACVLGLFGDRPVTGYTLLVLPIAAQEVVLAGYLLVRGFSARPEYADPARR